MAKVFGRMPRIIDNIDEADDNDLPENPLQGYYTKKEKFYRDAPPLDLETQADEYYDQLVEHYEDVFGEPFDGDRAHEIVGRLLFEKFAMAGRLTEIGSDEDTIKTLDQIAPNWRDGYLTPEEMRAIKRLLLGGSETGERSDEDVERDVKHWLGQMRRMAREKNMPPPPMPSWQRRAEAGGLRLPREVAAALGGRTTLSDEGEM